MIGTNVVAVSRLLPASMMMPPRPEISEKNQHPRDQGRHPISPNVLMVGPCSHAAVLGIIFVPADAAAWGFNRHMAGLDKNAAAHMEDAG
jgi:hypothetical protein